MILLVVDDTGEIARVEDEQGRSLEFDHIVNTSGEPELDPNVPIDCLGGRELESRIQRALNHAVSAKGGNADRTIPLPHCSFDGRVLGGCVHLLKPDVEPNESAWPLTLHYATGVTVLELERKLRDNMYMSIEFFESEVFNNRFKEILKTFKKPNGTPPGLVNAATTALAAMETATSPDFPEDPLLRTYRPGGGGDMLSGDMLSGDMLSGDMLSP